MHPALKQLEFLVGKWESVEAKGQFPNIKSFEYKEMLQFESIPGQPILNFNASFIKFSICNKMYLPQFLGFHNNE